MTKLENLVFNVPSNIVNEVKRTLRVYDEVTVIYENGQFRATTGVAIKKEYAKDFKVIGRYSKDDLYTKEMQILIYVEEFLSYPIEYKGKKDWNMINKLDDLRAEGKQAIMEYVYGNIQIKEIVEIR